MAEELYFKINSDVSGAVKGTEQYVKTLEDAEKDVSELNDTLKLQNEILFEQQQELVRLEQLQAKIGKGTWQDNITGTTKKIAEQKLEIKDQKLAMKGLAMQQKEAKEEVKAFGEAQKKNSLQLVDDIKNYKVFGISINGIGGAFKKIIPAAKAMFTTIKAGMISTGIGALVVAFGSLVAMFTQTKAGAESLAKIFAGVGAAVKVLVDRMVSWFGVLKSIVTLDFNGVVEGLKDTFGGLGDELTREIALAVQLKADLQALADAEREISVETANRKAEIEDLKLLAEDLTLTAEERITALQQAGDIEADLMAKRVANAEEALRIQQEQMSMSDNLAADLDKLAQLEINLANIRRESAKATRTILRKENSIRKQYANEERKRQNDAIKRQNQINRDNMALKRKFNVVIRELNEEVVRSLKKTEEEGELAVQKRRLEIKRDADLKLIEESKLSEKEKFTLQKVLFKKYNVDIAELDKEFKDQKKERELDLAQQLQDIQNENMVMQIEKDQERADTQANIDMLAEIRAVEGLENQEAQEEAIREKYRLLKEERDIEFEEKEKDRARQLSAMKMDLLNQGLDLVMTGLKYQENAIKQNYKKEKKMAEAQGKSTEKIEKDFQNKMRENAKKQKAMRIGMAIIDTYQSAVSAYAAGMSVGGPAGLVLGPVSAGLAVAAGLANVAMIEQQPLGDGGGGGGSSAGGGGAPSPEAPAPMMMGGAFDITGGEAPEPIQAFVITDDMTNSQNQLANIRRRATI